MGNCNLGGNTSVQVGDYIVNTEEILGNTKDTTLMRGFNIKDRRTYLVVKRFNKVCTLEEYTNLQPTFENLKSINNEHLLGLTDYHYDNEQKKIYLISKFCTYGNLHDLIHRDFQHDSTQDIKAASRYCQQIIKGMLALDDLGMYHGRLHPKNVLLQGNKLKLVDYGLPKELFENDNRTESIYEAPELEDASVRADVKSDIWSLGVMLYQILYNDNPFERVGNQYRFSSLQTGRCEPLDELIRDCLQLNPSKRITIHDLRLHPFVHMDISRISEPATSTVTLKRKVTFTHDKFFNHVPLGPNLLSA